MKLPPQKELPFHVQLVAMLRWALRKGVMMRHVPNGEHRDIRTAAKLKAMGTLAGSADLEFHWAEGDGRRRLLHLELKVGNRAPSHAQVMFATRVGLLGDGYYVVRSVDEAMRIIAAHGLIEPGVEVSKGNYDPAADLAGSLGEAYRTIRERKRKGGPGWTPKAPK